jgi:hypothetical protein
MRTASSKAKSSSPPAPVITATTGEQAGSERPASCSVPQAAKHGRLHHLHSPHNVMNNSIKSPNTMVGITL